MQLANPAGLNGLRLSGNGHAINDNPPRKKYVSKING
jgi:hypothetical protein